MHPKLESLHTSAAKTVRPSKPELDLTRLAKASPASRMAVSSKLLLVVRKDVARAVR